MRLFLALAFVCLAGCFSSEPGRAPEGPAGRGAQLGCAKDTDCKGERVCDRGFCADPRQSAAVAPAVRTRSSVLGPRPVGAEVSKYGSFEMTIQARNPASTENAECKVSFRHASGKVTPLFSAPDCFGDSPGSSVVGALEAIGEVPLPVQAGADEFHLFHISTARGGNAVFTTDYWAVVIRRDAAWATRAPFQAVTLSNGKLTPTSLLFDEAATTTAPGTGYAVRFGVLDKSALMMLPSSIVSKGMRVIVGQRYGPMHATGWRPSIQISPTSALVIDEDGACQLDALTGGEIRMTADVTEWSDGRTLVKCASIQR